MESKGIMFAAGEEPGPCGHGFRRVRPRGRSSILYVHTMDFHVAGVSCSPGALCWTLQVLCLRRVASNTIRSTGRLGAPTIPVARPTTSTNDSIMPGRRAVGRMYSTDDRSAEPETVVFAAKDQYGSGGYGFKLLRPFGRSSILYVREMDP